MSWQRWWPGRRRNPHAEAAPAWGALGLAADASLTDDDVRMAWRRVAAATHPDRADGGDPAAFAAAAADYTLLRTRSGRGELLAEDAGGTEAGVTGPPPHPAGAGQAADLVWRISHGRPWRLAARVAAALGLCAAALAVAGRLPAGPALVTGALTWLALTARRDVAPRTRLPPSPGTRDMG